MANMSTGPAEAAAEPEPPPLAEDDFSFDIPAEEPPREPEPKVEPKVEPKPVKAKVQPKAETPPPAADRKGEPEPVKNLLSTITGLCPVCRETEVTGAVLLSGNELLPACEGCRKAEEARQAQIKTAEAREALRDRHKNIIPILKSVGVDTYTHSHCFFGNFFPPPGTKDLLALKGCQDLITEYMMGKRPSRFLYSKRNGEGIAPGNGKTHLAVAIVRQMLVEGLLLPEQVRFIRETRLHITLRRLLFDSSQTRPEDYLDELIRVPVLVVDDVGKSKVDGAWMRELLFELWASREGRTTIRTSNYSPDDLIARDEEFWAPIVSRMFSGSVYELNGPDQRPEAKRQ